MLAATLAILGYSAFSAQDNGHVDLRCYLLDLQWRDERRLPTRFNSARLIVSQIRGCTGAWVDEIREIVRNLRALQVRREQLNIQWVRVNASSDGPGATRASLLLANHDGFGVESLKTMSSSASVQGETAGTVRYRGRILQRTEPEISTCDQPAAGWLGLVEYGTVDRRAQFDGAVPATRSGRDNTVPELGETLTFAPANAATIFGQSVPCYVTNTQVCTPRRISGSFVVIGRVGYNAGPGGGTRWQLCIVDEREMAR